MTGTTAARLDAVLRGEVVTWSSLETSPVELLRLCEILEISGLVHQRLAHSACLDDWPDDVRRELASRAHAATAIALVTARATAGVLDALAGSGIQPILLKG